MWKAAAKVKAAVVSSPAAGAAAAATTKKSLSSSPFHRLVTGLKRMGKTVTVVESCCGGTISASIMAIPGSSTVYHGGSIAYNTKLAKSFLMNDDDLHRRLLAAAAASSSSQDPAGEGGSEEDDADVEEADAYIRSKVQWTAEAARAFCEGAGVDYAIAEGGASGPTFRPRGLSTGFAAITVAGRDGQTGKATVLAQTVVRSTHANRAENMRLFADAAATLAVETVLGMDEGGDFGDDDDDGTLTSHNNRSTPPHEGEGAGAGGPWLDRATHLRADEEALRGLEGHPNARCVVLLDSKECLMSTSDDGVHLPRLALLPLRTVLASPLSTSFSSPTAEDDDDGPRAAPTTFLGLNPQGHPIFAVDITRDNHRHVLTSPEGVTGVQFKNTRMQAPLLPPHENELALYATALSNWKRTHRHCSSCGHGPLTPIEGGTSLKCLKENGGCGTQSWPRQDPSIIVLVTNRSGDRALLARSPRHPPKMHTALAGFVEAGETFEQAVIRETYEETGLHVDPHSIKYLSSQPWPFPRSCMVAFRATADDTQTIRIDPTEIVSAAWFDKRQVGLAATIPGAVMDLDVATRALAQNPSLEVMIPPQGVVARSLIDHWLEDA